MREIKFRAWDKTGDLSRDRVKRMIYSTTHPSTLSDLIGGDDNSETNEYTLMQYTGLKDKNGVEIYEGDIVTFRDCCGRTLTKKVEWIEEDAGFYPFGADYGCGDTVGTDHEVIGNIWENPELLEAQR